MHYAKIYFIKILDGTILKKESHIPTEQGGENSCCKEMRAPRGSKAPYTTITLIDDG